MPLPKTERPSSKLRYFVNVPMFVVIAVAMALYVVTNLLFLHWGGIHTSRDAVGEFLGGTISGYVGICLVNLVWDSLFY